MSASQSSFPVVPSSFQFAQHGKVGAWVSELLPHTAKIVDDLTFVKSMHTEAINHDPAVTFFQTGFQIAGRPSIGAWMLYGLGAETKNLPGFVVMISPGQRRQRAAAVRPALGQRFLPSRYQGVKFRRWATRCLYLSEPEGFRGNRRAFLDTLARIESAKRRRLGDPEISTRIAQYEMAFRMQSSRAGADGLVQGDGGDAGHVRAGRA